MRHLIKHIPNAITALNLICGLLAMWFFMEDKVFLSTYCILSAMVFDFMDGFLARILKAQSNFGKQFDSLADVISFGLAPAFLALNIMENGAVFFIDAEYNPIIKAIVILIPLFSALRLAKFNIDNRQSNVFLGLPTPANAFFYISMIWVYYSDEKSFLHTFLTYNELSALLITSFSFLMTSEIKLIAFKFNTFSWKDNKYKYILLIMMVILLIIGRVQGVVFIIPLYIIYSIIVNNLLIKKNYNSN